MIGVWFSIGFLSALMYYTLRQDNYDDDTNLIVRSVCLTLMGPVALFMIVFNLLTKGRV